MKNSKVKLYGENISEARRILKWFFGIVKKSVKDYFKPLNLLWFKKPAIPMYKERKKDDKGDDYNEFT